MPTKDKAFGERVKEYRIMRGLSQERAAALFGVSRVTLSKIENGSDCQDLTRGRIEKIIRETVAA